MILSGFFPYILLIRYHSLLRILKSLIRNSQRCQYRKLLNKHCKSPTIKRSDQVSNLKVRSTLLSFSVTKFLSFRPFTHEKMSAAIVLFITLLSVCFYLFFPQHIGFYSHSKITPQCLSPEMIDTIHIFGLLFPS